MTIPQPKTIAALAFVGLAAVGAWWEVSRDDQHPEVVPTWPLPAFRSTDIGGITIEDRANQTSIVLVRDRQSWKLTAPITDEADAALVEQILDQIANAQITSAQLADANVAPDPDPEAPKARGRASWSALHVGETEVVTITLRNGDDDIAVLHVGSDGRFARIGDNNQVHRIKTIDRDILVRKPRLWRNRRITPSPPFAAEQVRSVQLVDAAGRAITAQRIPDPIAKQTEGTGARRPQSRPRRWTITAGHTTLATVDDDVPNRIVSRMQTLRADDFADGTSRAAAGLDAPSRIVIVTLVDGRKHVLQIGAAADDEHTYVGRPDSGRVWMVLTSNLSDFAIASAESGAPGDATH